MGILSNISGKDAVKVFNNLGYIVDHQTGSHIILYHHSIKSREISWRIKMSSYVDTLQIYERLKVANLEEDAAKEIAEIFIRKSREPFFINFSRS